jgi:hypothetical protein
MKIAYFFITALCFLSVRADEDYSFEEFALDVGSGVAIAACEKDAKCSERMHMMTFIGILIGSIAVCVSPPNPEPFNRKKTLKRGGAVGSGYFLGKTFI